MRDSQLLGFMAVDSQSDHLAIGPLLEEWHPSVRESKRQEVLEFEEFYRADSLRDAAVLVERYGRPA
jgi:hypothetical protein